MALAVLKYLEKTDGHHVFEADIGTNTYYQYKTGKEKRKQKGLEVVDEVNHQSALIKAPDFNRGGFDTRFVFRIPENAINRDNRFIQLLSFKTQNQISPAISEVVTMLPSMSDFNGDYKLPKMMTLTHTNRHSSQINTEHAPCRIKENKVSEAMFFNAILGALPNLLTNALPMISKFIPGLQKALPVVEKLLPTISKIIPTDVKPGKEGIDQILNNISPETIKAILEVVQGVNAKSDNSVSNGKAEAKSQSKHSHDFSINPATLMQLAPLLEKVLSPETIKAIGDNPVQLFKAISDSAVKFQKMGLDQVEKVNPVMNGSNLDKTVQGMALRSRARTLGYSEAKIAPALLAALPALMPVLEKVLSPDMINAVGEQPVKLFNAIADAGLKHTKQELDHLEKINPGVDDPAFDLLAASMSIKSSVAIKAKFSNAYAIDFTDVKMISIGGKEKVVYDRRQKIHIPVKITSGERRGQKQTQIPKAIFQLIIQDGHSMSVLLEKKFRLNDITIGSPVTGITLDSDELKKLPLNRDLKLELSFHWKKGDKIEGTFKNHYLWLSDGYVYQRSGKTIQQHFALNDVSRFRNYWHKVWEGGPETHGRWNIDFECKYYYTLNDKDTNIRKLETKKKIVSDSAAQKDQDNHRRKISAKVKSGMEISLAAYNELLALHQLTPLIPAQLSAFLGQEFMKEAATAARVSVDFKGKKGETAALWAYPEGNIQSYILSKVTTVDPSGMITAAQEEEVFFPKFSTVHFIGTKSE
ncbi:MAG: hypothetical protein ABIR06_11065 [Cyclobacteriaceae bacterium]